MAGGSCVLASAARAGGDVGLDRLCEGDNQVGTVLGIDQQKLVVGREMAAGPSVLVAAHPTRGVDVGAQALIWDTLRDARAQGLAVLLVSADLEELIGIARDRLTRTLDDEDCRQYLRRERCEAA